MFELDPRLAADTTPITQLDRSMVLLMRDQTYPWLIVVPQIEGLRDFDDLDPDDRNRVGAEIDRASKALKQIYRPHKLNVGALGNIVEQLHIHVIARFPSDPAWPGPVWGAGERIDYAPGELAKTCKALQAALK